MSDTSREDDGWQEPDDIEDWFDDGDGGTLVPRKPKPGAGAPAMALTVPVG